MTAAPRRALSGPVIANLLGSAGSAILQLAFVPLYVRLLGIEAYGLVGFAASLQGVLMVLDLGLSATVNRELARLSARPERATDARDLVRTFEAWYWSLGLVLGLLLAAAAPLVARDWIRPGALPPDVVRRSVVLIGALIALQWPISLYQGGLLGLQRQVRLNVIRFLAALATAGGSALVLVAGARDVTAMLAWQAAASGVQVAVLAWSLWRVLPRGDRPARASRERLREVWRFAAGAGTMLAMGVLLTQLDKIVLSRVLPLGAFGYYALAATIGNGLYVVINPVFNAVFPRFSRLHADDDRRELVREYRAGLQAMAALVVPIAVMLALFPVEALTAWTGLPDTARAVAPIVQLLVLGTALNGLMHLPYALQLAHGWTSIGLRVCLLLLAVMAASLALTVPRFGARGAAASWLCVNVVYVLLTVHPTHQRLLGRGSTGWFLRDTLPAVVAALAVAAPARLLWSGHPTSRWVLVLALAAVGGGTFAAAALATDGPRAFVLRRIRGAARGRG